MPTAGLEILALCPCKQALARLVPALAIRGHRIDLAVDLATARETFLARGGHQVLLVAQDVGPGLAIAVVEGLRAIAADLRVLAFGHESIGAQRVERLPSFHPSGRAGIVAVLYALRG